MEARLSPWEKSKQQQTKLAELGVDDKYIRLLVNDFYTKIRTDPVIGKIFNDIIQDNWDKHLIRMQDFWSSLILNSKRYRGNPMEMHILNIFLYGFAIFRKRLMKLVNRPKSLNFL